MATPGRLVRFDDPDWAELGIDTATMSTDRSAVLRQLAAWWMRQPGARLPARPTQEQAQAARARVAGEQLLLERGAGLRPGRAC
jgi:hypothetical protein